MIHIDVISDTVCPWCFIGKRRLEKALAERPDETFEVEWRPFQLNPDMPPEGMPRQEYLSLKFGGPDRAARIYQNVSQAGAQDGLQFRFDAIPRQPNTFDSHRLIRWSASAGAQDAVVEILFRRYFLEGRDIGDREVLIEAAREASMDGNLVRELFENDADRDLVMAEEGTARHMGISGVPCFIVDRKYAVSGAQEPSVLTHVFDLAIRDREAAANGDGEPAQAAEEAAGD
jgi:predicted DsbA family dithiol-disulfide isomerase